MRAISNYTRTCNTHVYSYHPVWQYSLPIKIWFTDVHTMLLIGWFQETTDKQCSSGTIFSDEKKEWVVRFKHNWF